MRRSISPSADAEFQPAGSQTSRLHQPRAKTPGWNPWPVSIIAFFTVAIIGFGIFIAFCNTHRVDLVSADYYEQEMRYQGQMQRIQNAEGIASTTISYDGPSKTIHIALPPDSRHAATGRIQLYRPSDAALDRNLALAPDAGGRQAIDASNLRPGLWQVRVSWTAGKQEYYVDGKIIVGEGP